MPSNLFARVNEIPTEQVVRAYYPTIELKASGHELVGCCPIHAEKTPSFKINNEKNRWHCFGACAKGGSNIDLLLHGEIASEPLLAAKELARKFGIDAGDDKKPKRKAKVLTVSEYANFCALPEKFLLDTFSLCNDDSGIRIPYKDQGGSVVAVQRRHRLEKGKAKDARFSWRRGDKPIPYGVWLLPAEKKRLVVVEGASDHHVLTYCGIVSLGVPGAGAFKPEMTAALLPFAEIQIIQEPEKAGEQFVSSITAALKPAEYKGSVKAVSLPEKDPRALWLKFKDKAQFSAAMEQAIEAAAPIELFPEVPLTKDLIRGLADQIRRFIFFKNKHIPLLIAVWILATYIHERFQYFAILWITSPMMRCGKSKLVDFLDRVVWCSSGATINVSLAALYHMTAEGCTFLADEVENLKNSDREQYGAIMGIVNGGFAKGATVRRMVKVEGEWVQKKFAIYGPKVLAGIATVSDTIRDRSLYVKMIRKSRKERTERLNMRKEKSVFDKLNASMTAWAEQNGPAVERIYDDLKDQPDLDGCDDRFLDIAEPLLAVVRFADAEAVNGGGRIIDEILPLLKDMGGLRADTQNDEAIVALCGLLDDLLGASEKRFIASDELLAKTKETPGLQWIGSKKSLATFMGKLDFVAHRDPTGTKRGYTVTKEALEDIKSRYISLSPDFEVSEASETRSGRGPEGNL